MEEENNFLKVMLPKFINMQKHEKWKKEPHTANVFKIIIKSGWDMWRECRSSI